MSGIETAGLVLAVFPLVIDAVTKYNGLVKGRDCKVLGESLKNNEQMFLNSVEFLLRSTIPPEDLRVLLDDMTGELWKSEWLAARVTEHLGREAESVFKKIDDIYKTVSRLKQKLPSSSDAAIEGILPRANHVIKCFVRGPHYKASLEGLKTRISEFRILTKDALKLASFRNKSTSTSSFSDLAQECTVGLYEALKAGWKCDLDQIRPANIELDVLSIRTEEDSDAVRLRFSFSFADLAPQDRHEHWMVAEIVTTRADPDDLRPAMFGTLRGAPAGSLEFHSSNSAGTSAMAQAISPSGSTVVVSATIPADKGTPSEVIGDLSAMLKGLEECRSSIMSNTHQLLDLSMSDRFSFSKPDPIVMLTSAKLAEFFSRRSMMSKRNRIQLALVLAWGVAQISFNSWLDGKWTNIRFQSSHQKPQSVTLTPAATNNIPDWVSNASLFTLGVFLIEMCYNRSIEELATKKERNERGEPWEYTSILTAMRLSSLIQDEMGLCYAQAVRACLHFPKVELGKNGRPKDSSQFALTVMRDIIDPLKTVAHTYEQ